MRKNDLLSGLLALLFFAVVGWLLWAPSSDSAPTGIAERVAPKAGGGSMAGAARGGTRPLGTSPFLTTHEQARAFEPDGENLAPSFHVRMEALKRTLENAPRDTTALIRMARLLQDGHRTEEAVTYYRQYLDLHPEGRQAWLDLAQSYGVLKRWGDALEITRDMLRRFPDDPAALYNLGAIYANTGRSGEARATWERVARQARNDEMRTLAEGALKRLDPMHP